MARKVQDDVELSSLRTQLASIVARSGIGMDRAGIATLTSPSGLFDATVERLGDSNTLRVTSGDPPTVVLDVDEVVDSVLWATESDLIFTVVDDSGRACEVKRALFSPSGCVLETMYVETSTSHYVTLSRTSDGKYLRIASTNRVSNSLVLYDVISGQLSTIHERSLAAKADADSGAVGVVIAVTDHGCTEWRLVTHDLLDHPVRAVAADSHEYLWFRVFDEYLVVAVADCVGGTAQFVRLVDPNVSSFVPSPGQDAYLTSVARLSVDRFQLSYASLSEPEFTLEWSVRNGVTRGHVSGNEEYRSDRLYFPSADGTEIPVSILFTQVSKRIGPRPLLLLAYGCYGHAFLPLYADVREVLLDRGVLFGIAHVRGGGELGRSWHLAGRGTEKVRAVDDLIAVVDGLVDSGWAQRDAVVLRAQSAGAAVVTGAIHRRPDLACGVVLDRPHFDVHGRFGLNSYLRDYDRSEFGESAGRGSHTRAWAPFDVIPDRPLPPMLLRPGTLDERAPAAESFKYRAFCREWAPPPVDITITPTETGHWSLVETPDKLVDGLEEVFGWILQRTSENRSRPD